MSWLRDPRTGDPAGPLNEDELQELTTVTGRRKQRASQHWVIRRDADGKAKSVELESIPLDERGPEHIER